MTTHLFWAPQTGNNGNSGTSLLAPKKDFSAFGTFSPDTIVFGLNGEIHDGAALGRVSPAFSSSPSPSATWTLKPYPGHPRIILDGGGTRDIGFRPAVAIDQANGPRDLIVEDLEIRNYTTNGFNIGEVSADGSNYNGSVARRLWIHHIASASESGLKAWGTDLTVDHCLVEDVGGDGLFIHGANAWVHHNRIRRVSNTGGTLGDGIQFNRNSHDSIIEWNYIERENSDKQALLYCGDRGIVRYNVLRGFSVGAGLMTLYSSAGTSTDCEVYGNILIGTDGIYLLDATGPHEVWGNLIIGLDPNETDGNSTGIDKNGSYNHLIHHNTVVGHRRGIFGQGCTVRNNIVISCGGIGISTGSGAVVESHNCSFGNGTNFSGTPGTGSKQVDPALREDYMPTNPEVVAAGTAITATDLYGMPFAAQPTMGAVQYQQEIAGAALPAFLYDNRLNDGTPVASTTEEDFDVLNLADLRPYSFWKPTTLPATITVDCGEAVAADFAAIYRHDLGTCGCVVEIRGSADNFASSDDLLIRRSPSADEPLLLPFASSEYRYWRITIDSFGHEPPTLAIALIGEALRLPRRQVLGFDPVARSARTMTNQSAGGYPLGKVTAFEEWRQKVALDVVQWDWLRDTWLPAWREHLRDEPFLYAWDSTDHPTELYLVTSSGEFAAPTLGGDKCSFEVEISGAVP